MPPFVFSITGQVSFRTSLDHIVTCRTRQCASLRKKVREGMHAKLQWLFEEQALLGCVHVQPFLYQEKRAVNIKQPKQFSIVANHLAHCPNESCSRLRRAVLLSIRDKVSPASRNNE